MNYENISEIRFTKEIDVNYLLIIKQRKLILTNVPHYKILPANLWATSLK